MTVGRSTTATAAGGFAAEHPVAGYINQQLRAPRACGRSAANAGSVMSKGDGGGSAQTCTAFMLSLGLSQTVK